MDERRSRWVFVLVSVWLQAGFIFYVFFHPPLSLDTLIGLGRAGWDLLASLWLLALAGGLAWRWVDRMALNLSYKLGLSSMLGITALGALTMLYGTLLPLNAWVVCGALLLATTLTWRAIYAWLHALWQMVCEMQPDSRLGWTLAAIIGIGFALALARALAPPLAYDALVYHLSLPQRYIQEGHILITPATVFSGMPQTQPMGALLLMLAGVRAPAVLGWWFGVLAALVVWQLVRAGGSNRLAWVGLGMLFAGKSFYTMLTTGYTASAAVLLGALALALFAAWRDTRERGLLIALGALLGAAYTFKQPYIFMAVLFGLLLLWELRTDRRLALRAGAILALTATGVMAPWLLRTALGTGNPFFPLLFPSSWMTPDRFAMFNRTELPSDWLSSLLLPFRATFWAIEDHTLGAAPEYSAEIGALLLLFGVFAWLGSQHTREQSTPITLTAKRVAISGLLLWALAIQLNVHFVILRFFFWLFPALAVVAVLGLRRLFGWMRAYALTRQLALLVIVLSVAFATLEFSLDVLRSGALSVLAGGSTEQDYVRHNLGEDALIWQDLNAKYAAGTVKLLFEARDFYCYPACLADDNVRSWFYTLRETGSPEAVLATWRAAGAEALLVRHGAIELLAVEFTPQMLSELVVLERTLAELPIIQEYNGATLYALP